MLSSLQIRNLALIDELEVTFHSGLTVLTGETGAGKSIIVGALNLVLGDRAHTDVVRQGVDEAVLEALFELKEDGPTQAMLLDMDLADPDGALVVRRIISRSGKNRLYLNGHLATLTDLRRVVAPLIDISSQHAHTSLLKVPEHRVILDRHGDLGGIIQAYRTVYDAWRTAEEAFCSLQAAEAEREERAEFLRYQIQELEELDPKPGEDQKLVSELAVLRHAERLREATSSVENVLDGDRNGVLTQLSELERVVADAAEADPSLHPQLSRLESVRIELQDIAMDARDYRARIDANPARLVALEERLDRLRQLMRRHGPELQNVIEKGGTMRVELEKLESYDQRLQELQERVEVTRREAEAIAHRLTAARQKAAKDVTRRIEAQLADLAMPDCRFVVDITPTDSLGESGRDRVEFLLGPNPGEDPKPLARIASGGELSRIMLAIKHVLADVDAVDCYVFDEVDAGVSGGVAERIGVKLRDTARHRQVVCITHLPQVACHADHHFRVHKETIGKRACTQILVLNDEERQEEVARLLAGVEITDKARAHALELIRNAAAR
jgi:DNA repair protein RecN (Recombination protein N)